MYMQPGDNTLAKVALALRGKVDAEPPITYHYTSTSVLEAFEALQSSEKGLAKTVNSGSGVGVDRYQSDEDEDSIRRCTMHRSVRGSARKFTILFFNQMNLSCGDPAHHQT
ncbi:hypothetical protein PM082_000667 [Marasmius tenuissimus]|nr:hypothetical protein PM082_000667 [Marasmius tenuissimus]